MKSITLRNTFSILFFMHRSKFNKNGEHPIYCRVTVQGRLKEFATQIWSENEKWNPSSSKMSGSSEKSKTANNAINTIRNNLLNVRADLQSQGKPITAENVVNVHLGKNEKKHSLIEVHTYFNEHHVKKLIGKNYAAGTYTNYKTSLEHVSSFIRNRFNKSDILLNELSFSFATDYELYLKTVKNCCNNTSLKHIKNLKAVLNFAVNQEWIAQNLLQRFKGKLDRVNKEFLTENDLRIIENKIFENTRLSEIRDIFIFCCYTGLSYSDVSKLSRQNIVIGMNGGKQINIRRTKTDVAATVPLLSKALNILDKYAFNEFCIYHDKLLPVKSNQKHNAYLKEIGDICNCTKKLTTHTARHTFATLMLTKGVSIESISSMLGHTNIKTTQIYGKIIAEKVTTEMNKINELIRVEFAAEKQCI